MLWSGSRVVLEKLLDKVDVGHDHTAAAVSLETELVHSVAVYSVSSSSTPEDDSRPTHRSCGDLRSVEGSAPKGLQ
jgi:hypothetical protein